MKNSEKIFKLAVAVLVAFVMPLFETRTERNVNSG